MRITKILSTLVVGLAIVTVVSITVISQKQSTSAQTTIINQLDQQNAPECPTSTKFSYASDASANGSTIYLSSQVMAEFHITSYMSLSDVKIYAEDTSNSSKLIGKAMPQPSSEIGISNWYFSWPISLWNTSSTTGPSLIKLYAIVKPQNGSPCSTKRNTDPIFSVTSQATSSLRLESQTTSISLPAGSNNQQEISLWPSAQSPAYIQPQQLMKFGVISWSLSDQYTGGIATGADNFLEYKSILFYANNPGQATISAAFSYGGSTSNILTIPVQVIGNNYTSDNNTNNTTVQSNSSDTSINYSNNNSSTDGNSSVPNDKQKSIDNVTAENLDPIKPVSSSKVNATDYNRECIVDGLGGQERFNQINKGESKPTTGEFVAIHNCFATSGNIIPTNFIPLPPKEAEQTAISSDVTMDIPQNTKTASGQTSKQAIKLMGKSKPKTLVFIYIYSDPIVVSVVTDENGNWEYIIDNPLEPGKHEVYAVVNTGDGSYKRSDPITFLIATATASSANPNGLSLELAETPRRTAEQSKRNMYIYIAASAVLLLIALVVLLVIIKSHHKHKVSMAQLSDPNCPHCGNDTTQPPIDVKANQNQNLENQTPTINNGENTPTDSNIV